MFQNKKSLICIKVIKITCYLLIVPCYIYVEVKYVHTQVNRPLVYHLLVLLFSMSTILEYEFITRFQFPIPKADILFIPNFRFSEIEIVCVWK